jgi:hypothetical protein
LALFGRRPLQRVVSLVIPATKNLHNNGHCASSRYRLAVSTKHSHALLKSGS